MSRYARQTCLPEVGPEGQRAISAAHVLVVGAGGLAAPALQYLVGAGVGHLSVIDADRVSETNLHRQTLFREPDIGVPKVEAAASTLRRLNSDCTIEPIHAALDPANVAELVARSSLVLDCADSFAVSYTLSDACLAARVPLISASVLGFGGYVGGFCHTAPSLRAVFPDLPERAQSCATAGVMGPVVGLIGAAQAQMALAQLIGRTPSPLGQMMQFDMGGYRSASFRFDGTPEPEADLAFIAPCDLAPDDFVVELRDTDEAPDAITKSARRSSVSDFTAERAEPRTGQRAVFACRSGLRAWRAATHLRSYWAGPISLIATGDTPHSEG